MIRFPESDRLYAFKFAPVYVRRMWGGKLLAAATGRTDIPAAAPDEDPVGEAWEVTDRDDAQSVVTNGELSGATLRELIEHYGEALLGGRCPAGRFPLLVKFIDAGSRLSLQVHPDETYCQREQDGSEPKTEMWYIVDCAPHGEILAGLAPRTTRDQFIEELATPRAADLLQRFPSQTGDSYFIQAGTVHAIGAGNLIYEIQQNSDTTFRISDWGRVALDGKPRKLHLAQGIKAIGFSNRISPRIPAVVGETRFNRKFPIVDRHCFKVDCLRLVEAFPDRTGGISGSFHLLSVMKGAVRVELEEREAVHLGLGECTLIPAAAGAYQIVPEGAATVLKSYIM